MATATPPVGVATCPLCGDYEGKPSSVEGHISAMTDEAHSKSHGLEYRDEIKDSVESGSSDGVESEASDSVESDSNQEATALDSPVNSGAGGSVGSGSSDSVESKGADSVDSAADSSATKESETADDTPVVSESGGSGIPLPVSGEYVVIGAAAFLVLALAWRLGTSSSSSEPVTTGVDEEQDAVSQNEVSLIQ